MSKHLGRNPFEKRKPKVQAKRVKTTRPAEEPQSRKSWSGFSDWALVQLPAQSVVFALKTVLRVKSLIERE